MMGENQRNANSEREPATGRRFGRRRLMRLLLGGTGFAGIGTAGYAWRIEPVWPELVRQRMAIPGLPADLVGLRIIQLSDPHVGGRVPLDYLTKWLDWIEQRGADVVVVTGDVVHFGSAGWTDVAARLLGRPGLRDRLLVVLGNHDWGTSKMGHGQEACASRVTAAMTARAVRVLNNESISIERGTGRLHVVGLDDYWGNRFDPAAAFAGVPEGEPCIALSHNPDSFWDLLETPASWVLSGHTHGGQVNLPLVGPPLVPVRHKQYVAGHFRLAGKNLYVNRGLGWLLRVRFNARPEITEFTLEQG